MSSSELLSSDSASNVSQEVSEAEKISTLYQMYNKGFQLIKQRKYEEAVQCYKNAQEIDPYRTSSWYNMGVALSHLGRNDEAVDCFDKVMEIDPKNYWAKYYKLSILSE